MCKKLSVLLLVVLGLSMPALAEYIGFPSGCENPLKVHLTYGPDNQQAPTGWQTWQFARDWTGPVGQNMSNPWAGDPWEVPYVQLETFRTNQTPPADHAGLARNRGGGFAGVAGTNEYNQTGKGLGSSYVKLTVTDLQPSTSYKIILWGYEAYGVWSMSTANPYSKFGVWSTVNPWTWLVNNGYGPGGPNTSCTLGGYGPKFSIDNPVATTDTNMPCAMKDVVLAPGQGKRFSLMADVNDGSDHVGDVTKYNAKLCNVMTSSNGTLVVYGWIDSTDWSGSMHLPLNGFMIVPEPITVALLGLGGLALIRRKRA